jgi:hypothetical protein
MGGKNSSAGAIAGMALGALFALPTGGMSVGVGAAIGGAAGSAAGNIKDVSDTNKVMKSAAANADAQAQAQAKALKDAQDTASSQAQAAVNSRRARYAASNTIFTNPLGIAGLASTAKKTLLGQ